MQYFTPRGRERGHERSFRVNESNKNKMEKNEGFYYVSQLKPRVVEERERMVGWD